MSMNPQMSGGALLPNKRNILIVSIITLMAVGGLLIGHASFAQSPTTTTTNSTTSGASSTYTSGHNCPNMNTSGSSSSSSTGSSTTG